MSIPEKLVTAAAQRLCRHRLRREDWPCPDCRRAADAALAAAFAALPECEEAVAQFDSGMYGMGWRDALTRLAGWAES